MIVPVIVEGWKLHLYGYVPAVLNWNVNVSPVVSKVCELHTPVVLVVVCVPDARVHITLQPAVVVTEVGEKKLLLTVTCLHALTVQV
jgi:hypothetical protein